MNFTFYLDSLNGRFDLRGNIKNVSASQLNPIAEPLANTRLESFNMHTLDFNVWGDDYTAYADVSMLYDNLFVSLRKTDEESGATVTKKFLTKLINKYTLEKSNPGPDGRVRSAKGVVRSRLLTQPFFGLVWRTIFTGIQDVMMDLPH